MLSRLVRVNSGHDRSNAKSRQAAGEQLRSTKQMRQKDANPEDAVRLALWLASESSRRVTGKIFRKMGQLRSFSELFAGLFSELFTMAAHQSLETRTTMGDK